MKKIGLLVIVMVMVVTGVLTMTARDRVITVGQLPQAAQTFVGKYFKKSQIALVKEDKETFSTDYEVTFSDGSKIDFNGAGEWKEVNSYAGVPTSIVPKQVMNFLKKNQYMGNGVTVRKIERERSGWKVELSNNMEFEFDKSFQLRDIDRD